MLIKPRMGERGIFGGYMPNGKVILIDREYHKKISIKMLYNCTIYEKGSYAMATDLVHQSRCTNLKLSATDINKIAVCVARKFVNPSNMSLFDMCIDFAYEGMISFLNYYDPTRGANESTFLSNCMTSSVLSNMKHIEMSKLQNCNNDDYDVEDKVYHHVNYIEDLDRKSIFDRAVEKLINKNLTYYNVFVFRYILGKTYVECGLCLECTPQWVEQVDKKLLEYLNKFMER